MFLPLKDDNPGETVPFITIGLIIINVLVTLYQIYLLFAAGPKAQYFIYNYGAIPLKLSRNLLSFPPHIENSQITLITSMFLHGGFLHLAGNMLYLWIFGNNVEDALGHFRYLIFYFLCGIAAAYLHILTAPYSKLPMIGASGAVSGVLGAYLLLFPRARVLSLIFLGFFWDLVRVPAMIVLGFWIVLQLVYGIFSLGGPSGGGVAWFAHVGGFVAGMALLFIFKKRKYKIWGQTGYSGSY